MVNNCEGYVNFQDIEHQLQQNILHHNLIVVFFGVFVKLKYIFKPHKTHLKIAFHVNYLRPNS